MAMAKFTCIMLSLKPKSRPMPEVPGAGTLSTTMSMRNCWFKGTLLRTEVTSPLSMPAAPPPIVLHVFAAGTVGSRSIATVPMCVPPPPWVAAASRLSPGASISANSAATATIKV